MYIQSHAKINLILNVIGKKEDGYHELDMIMLPINLSDLIEFTVTGETANTHVVCNKLDLSLRSSKNIVRVVVDAMRAKYGFKENFDIKINKLIPMCSGLGGGSSNAANVYKTIKNKLKLDIDDNTAIEDLIKIGSDVPFFYFDKPARVQGTGEKLTPIKIKKKYYALVVKPEGGLSTKEVYNECDNFNLPIYNIDDAIKALETGDDELLVQTVGNSLTEPAIKLLPEIDTLTKLIKSYGIKIVMMSGSGSAVFALSSKKSELIKAALKLSKIGYELYLTKVIK